MKLRSVWIWRKTLASHRDHPRWMLVITCVVEPKAAGAGALHGLTAPSSHWGTDPRPPNLLCSPWISSDPSQAQTFSLSFISSYLRSLGLMGTFTSWWAVAVPTGGKIKVNQVHYLSSDSDQHTQFREGGNIPTLIKQGNYFLALQSFLYLFKETPAWQ